MKKLVLLLMAMFIVMFSSCAVSKLTPIELKREKVYISDTWATASYNSSASMLRLPKYARNGFKVVTLVVANPTKSDVRVESICVRDEGAVFGKRTIEIPAKSKRKFVIRGFTTANGVSDHDSVKCFAEVR
jgi:hypothetical protein